MTFISTFKLTEKKSKFYGFLYKVIDEDEMNSIISQVKKDHQKAAHVCYGWQIGNDEQFKNDGEVGQPGRALLDCLKEKEKTSHVLVVVRYYGGIKLGPGGVSRAFRTTGRNCLSEKE